MKFQRSEIYLTGNESYDSLIKDFRGSLEVESVIAFIRERSDRLCPASIVALRCAFKRLGRQRISDPFQRAFFLQALSELEIVRPVRRTSADPLSEDGKARIERALPYGIRVLIYGRWKLDLPMSVLLSIRFDELTEDGDWVLWRGLRRGKTLMRRIPRPLVKEFVDVFDGKEWVFERGRKGGPISRQYVWKVIRRTAEKEGVKANLNILGTIPHSTLFLQ